MNSDTPDRDELRYEHLQDNAGWSPELAREAVEGTRPLGGSAVNSYNKYPTHAHSERPHYSRRGGKAYPEPSDSELDPDMQTGPIILSPEQIRVNDAGIALTKATVEYVNSDEVKGSSKEEKEKLIEAFIERYLQEHSEE